MTRSSYHCQRAESRTLTALKWTSAALAGLLDGGSLRHDGAKGIRFTSFGSPWTR